MNSIAAGMESDISDSDCDIVYSTPENIKNSVRKHTSSRKKPELEFVPVPKSAVINRNFNHCDTNAEVCQINESRPQKRNDYHRRNQGRQSKWREKPSAVQNSQPLDDLRYAVLQGNLPVVKDILAKDISVDCVLKAGWTPLMYASSAAQPEIVLHLLENKANPNYHKDHYTPLMAVCASSKDDEENLLKCCCYLLKFGAEVNVHERHLTTPLMFAAREGHLKIVKELLNAGAVVQSRDNRGRTVLSWAAFGGHGIIVRLLLNSGSDPQEVDLSGQTAADLARHNGHNEVAAVLERCSLQKDGMSEPLPICEEPKDALSKTNRRLLNNSTSNYIPKPKEKYYEQQGELELFLNGIGLSYLISVFKDQHLSFSDLLIMCDEELEKIGISQIGVRKKILEASKATHKKEWEKSSLPNLAQCQYISCPDAVAMMANIAKHLKYISASVIYIRTQIQSQPRILELAQETANVHDLLDEMEDGLKNVRNLDDELRFLKLHLKKVQGNAEYILGDLVIETAPKKCDIVKRTLIFGFVAVTIGGALWQKPTALTHIVSFFKSNLLFPFINKT